MHIGPQEGMGGQVPDSKEEGVKNVSGMSWFKSPTDFLCVFFSTSCLPPFHLLHVDGNPLTVPIHHTY